MHLTDPEKREHMLKLSAKLRACASRGVIAIEPEPAGPKGITAFYCGEKICYVCNSMRMRSTRRKYYRWFSENRYLNEIRTKKGTRILTDYQLEKNYPSEPVLRQLGYDIVHLVLTVPHSLENGFRGRQLYYDDIQEAFKNMRRQKFWKDQVFGGEYGVETEKKDNGNHIHIHALLFVRTGHQNRNRLHRDILIAWNQSTIDTMNKRTVFAGNEFASIMKGNKLITEQDCFKLNPQGATFINMKSIFVKSASGKEYRKFEWGSKAFMKATMEAIKYHFQPLFFDKEEKRFDLELIADLKPLLHGRRLYEKFGCLRGETSLNISENIVDEYEQAAGDVDHLTGEILTRDHLIVNARHVFNADNRLCLSAQGWKTAIRLKETSTHHAVKQLSNLIKLMGKSGQLGTITKKELQHEN